MIARLLLAILAAAPLPAQLTLSVLRDNMQVPVGSQVQLPSTAAGDILDTLFRLSNPGDGIVPITTLSIAGESFSLTNPPGLPTKLLPGAYLDFAVRFQPSTAASYSAFLKAGSVSAFVLATAVPVLTVYVQDDGSKYPADTAAAIDFGAVERGGQAVRRFLLVNETAQPLAAPLSLVGTSFQLVPGAPTAVMLDPLTSASVDVRFTPVQAGSQQGELRVDQRRFPLRGSTVEPPLPKPIVTLDFGGASPASGKQPQAAIHFDPAPRTSGTGTLRLDFHPSVAAEDDPAILFLSTSSRQIDFSIIEGEPDAQFGLTTAIPLQTGSTAGSLVLTAEVGDDTETTSVEIPPQPVVIDTVQTSRSTTSLDVQVSGYDNTRTLSQASFTFLRKDGTVIPPGTMKQDLASAFKDYFANSTLGGSFQMKVSFPITGSADLIDSMRVVIDNQAGTTTWPAP